MTIKCNHKFHGNCIVDYYRQWWDKRCPYCRDSNITQDWKLNVELCKKIDLQKKRIMKMNNLIKKFKKTCNTKNINNINKKYNNECKKFINNYKRVINKGLSDIHKKYDKI